MYRPCLTRLQILPTTTDMKKSLFVALIVYITVLCTSCVGPFFVYYALETHDLTQKLRDSRAKDVSEMNPHELYIYDNAKLIRQHTDSWLECCAPESWSQKTPDGLTLRANFFENKDSHKYAIIIHGWTSKKEDMYNYGAFFYDWGYSVLAPDNRAHGSSDGQYTGMGWLDSNDYLEWINMIIRKDPDAQITMLGVSMGGATVMMTSGLDLPANVKCLVEDCGYSNVWDEFAYMMKEDMHLPVWPLLDISANAADRMVNYSIREASSLTRLEKAKIPMLFIHGTEDTFVPYAMLDENIAAYKGPYKEVLRVEGAQHAEALFQNTELYLKTVKAFCDKFIK